MSIENPLSKGFEELRRTVDEAPEAVGNPIPEEVALETRRKGMKGAVEDEARRGSYHQSSSGRKHL